MVKKQCGRCGKVSYSLSAKGRWICPGCGADLAHQPTLAQDSSTSRVLPVSGENDEKTGLN